ncbi:MAG: hypothetical protein II584_03155, partial [Treponema sp.]|nr:hypothetical protein [Treponema sp.]
IDGDLNHVCFGDWPQRIMPSDVTVDESITTERGGYTYCYGSDGYWYAKCIENVYLSNTYSDGTPVKSSSYDSTRYFRVEPVKWRVLNPDDDGDKLLLSEQILINCAYYDTNDVDREIDDVPVYPNNYEKSRVRAFLNGLSYKVKETGDGDQTDNDEFSGKGFLNTAFTESARDMIVVKEVDNTEVSANPSGTPSRWDVDTYVCNNIQDDRIFLLSEQEATTTDYGFGVYSNNDDARKIVTTDFAKANGAFQYNSSGKGGNWWLRSPSNSTVEKKVRSINYNGYAGYEDSVNDSSIGVVPALYVNF